MNSLHNLKNNKKALNGKMSQKLSPQTKNSFHLKIRNHRKSTICLKMILKTKLFFQNKQKIKMMKANNYNKKIMNKQFK